jgi:LPXTG-site transpeptidase (sortase) family protein
MTRTYTRRHFMALSIAVPPFVAGHEPSVARSITRPATLRNVMPATEPCLPATPADASDTCERGPVPITLRIPAIGVDAPIEVLETVAGVMQQPSDEVHVAWYKESARLGEVGNIWLAAHLNCWGFPQAVFSDLKLLREGDEVTVLDASETPFHYTVEWVRQESNLEPPRQEVLGMTGHEAVTLITCGGEWDNTISEYNERTVARAVRMHDLAASSVTR